MCTLFFLASFATGYIQQGPDLSTPEATVKAFAGAIGRAELRTAMKCVDQAQWNPTVESVQKVMAQRKMTLTLTDLVAKTAGSTSVVTFIPEAKSSGTSFKGPKETLKLSNKAGKWMILAPDASKSNGKEMLTAVAVLFTNEKKARELYSLSSHSADNTACLSNVKQVCLGLMMFCTDNDDKFNLLANVWKPAIMPYLKNDKLFKCPSGGELTFNKELAGKTLASVQDPANTVMVYETKFGKQVFLHDGKMTVGFVDSHVMLLTPEALKSKHWEP